MNGDDDFPSPPPPVGSPKDPPKKDSKGKSKKKGVGKGVVVGLVITGIIFMMLGGMFGHVMDQVWKYPNGDDKKYDGDNDGLIDTGKGTDLDEDRDRFELRRTWDRALENIGVYFFLFGICLLIIGFLVGGLMCNDLPDMVRLGMIVAVGFLVFYWV